MFFPCRHPQDADACPSERTACSDDDGPGGCSECLLGYDVTNCDLVPLDCSELVAQYCCALGGAAAGCGNNTALVTLVGENIHFGQYRLALSDLGGVPHRVIL